MKVKLILFFLLCQSLSYAGKDEENYESLKETVQKVDILKEAKSGPNSSINYDCHDCISEVELSKAVKLDREEVKMDRTLFLKGKDDGEFTIIRTKDSPDKVTIKFKERYRSCKKTVAHQNPLSGQIGFSCMYSSSEFRDDSITIDFSDRPLKGDSEAIKVRLVKLSASNKGFINASFKDQSGRGVTSSRGGSFLFFGTKYNLE
ncbi:putative exported protein [Halobacteriovorax marinus SJ]|uniref:Exported protein n=1 Tax=Halobacteriovorax marinus (strain ATCC BAA-682 / DSM 15412 / SJ) TaxID=862908 RepID=E1X370_HALMS|nr:hypothetical protein [Halobacteriovorax marinus]CBW26900.1 putative exported protein [Halobacteriovorax marinus SJ]